MAAFFMPFNRAVGNPFPMDISAVRKGHVFSWLVYVLMHQQKKLCIICINFYYSDGNREMSWGMPVSGCRPPWRTSILIHENSCPTL